MRERQRLGRCAATVLLTLTIGTAVATACGSQAENSEVSADGALEPSTSEPPVPTSPPVETTPPSTDAPTVTITAPPATDIPPTTFPPANEPPTPDVTIAEGKVPCMIIYGTLLPGREKDVPVYRTDTPTPTQIATIHLPGEVWTPAEAEELCA
jgi:hypothetical protein